MLTNYFIIRTNKNEEDSAVRVAVNTSHKWDMVDDDETIDLFSGQVGSTNNYIPFSNKDSISTAKYLNETIGNVIGDILDQCSRDAPPDPILYLAELLERLDFLLEFELTKIRSQRV